ncbi:MAG: hypothetical protein WCV93_05640 [Candidatus Shapirobacteria bacterium]|jgi:hypothetical protein
MTHLVFRDELESGVKLSEWRARNSRPDKELAGAIEAKLVAARQAIQQL